MAAVVQVRSMQAQQVDLRRVAHQMANLDQGLRVAHRLDAAQQLARLLLRVPVLGVIQAAGLLVEVVL